MTFRVIVIGAGAAGCAVAETLARNAQFTVTVVEAGTPTTRAPDDLFDAGADGDRVWPSLRATYGPGSARPYLRGRGIGGTGSINGRILQVGRAADYDAWGALPGCSGWNYCAVEPHLAIEIERARGRVRTSRLGPVDTCLAQWAEQHGERCDGVLTHDRLSVRDLGSAKLLAGRTVSRILFDGHAASGVAFADGTRMDADLVVLSAGAIFSPALLLQSGLTRPGIGQNLHEHFGVAVSFPVADKHAYEITGVVADVERNDIPLQVLPINRTSLEPGTGAVFVGVMQQWSRGMVTLNDDMSPRVSFNTSVDARDAVALDVATEVLREVASPFGESVTDQSIYPANYYHAAGTCRMGAANDPHVVVDNSCAVFGVTGLHVIDASIFPNQPAANPYLPTLAAARVAASRIAESLG